jgi:hypothetical protein
MEGQEKYFEGEDERIRAWEYVMCGNAKLEGWGVLRDMKEEWRSRGRWVCVELARESGRVLPSWEWIEEEEDSALVMGNEAYLQCFLRLLEVV